VVFGIELLDGKSPIGVHSVGLDALLVHLLDALLLAVLPEAPYPRLVVPLRVEALAPSELFSTNSAA